MAPLQALVGAAAVAGSAGVHRTGVHLWQCCRCWLQGHAFNEGGNLKISCQMGVSSSEAASRAEKEPWASRNSWPGSAGATETYQRLATGNVHCAGVALAAALKYRATPDRHPQLFTTSPSLAPVPPAPRPGDVARSARHALPRCRSAAFTQQRQRGCHGRTWAPRLPSWSAPPLRPAVSHYHRPAPTCSAATISVQSAIAADTRRAALLAFGCRRYPRRACTHCAEPLLTASYILSLPVFAL